MRLSGDQRSFVALICVVIYVCVLLVSFLMLGTFGQKVAFSLMGLSAIPVLVVGPNKRRVFALVAIVIAAILFAGAIREERRIQRIVNQVRQRE